MSSKRRPADGQKQLPFALRLRGLRSRLGIPSTTKFLIVVMWQFVHDNPEQTCWPSQAALAAAMDCGVKTVKRALAQAVGLGLVAVLRRGRKGCGSNKYRILWSEIFARAGLLDALLDASAAGGGEAVLGAFDAVLKGSDWPLENTGQGVNLSTQGVSLSTQGVKLTPRNLQERNKKEKPPPLGAQRFGAQRSAGVAAWKAVEVDLVNCGLALPAEAVARAALRGHTPESAAAVVAFWRSRPGAWGPGALFKRLAESPALAPDQGWPAKSDSYRKSQEAAARSARVAAERAAAVPAVALAGGGDRLEAEFGPVLDSLPQSERGDVERAACGEDAFLRRLAARGELPRHALLREVERRFA